MNMGISGFEPSYLVGIDAVRQAHGPRLAALAGRRLTGFALVRFAEDGDWYADCPVVLDFDGSRVEICHRTFDELSLGWDTIHTSAAITGWEWSELTPQWSHRDDRLEAFVGRRLLGVTLLEWRPTGRDLADGTVALEFVFDAGRLRITNGLDENSIEVGPTPPEFVRYEPVSRRCS
ncbi:hypothetical protein [Streptomyces erythrochromogenes]|uniref:hypothetical protein n=1 Tax=Streptomyces erythrochromogenes TaxID=285574 RepID=UPI00369B5EE9